MAERSVRIQVLGSLRVWRDGEELDLGPPGRRAVLGLLALAAGDAMTIRDLVDALWGDRPPRSAVNVLQTHVKHLRRLLEPGRAQRTTSEVLPRIGGGYALRRDTVEVDLLHVRRLIADANGAHRGSDTARVAALLGEALRDWPGRPLADIPVLAKHPKVEALVAERREALTRYGDAMITVGAAADVLPDLAEAAAEQPLDESAQALLIRAYHAVGQRAEAFRVYREARSRLVEELGVGPGPDLVAAHTALLHDGTPDEAVPARSGTRAKARAPKQLPPETRGFTGRSAELSVLDGLLPDDSRPGGTVPVAAISGGAGIGKTALAVHWAHRVRDRFPDGQLYANLRGHAHGPPAEPVEILAQFLSALGIPAERVPVDVETASALYRTLLTDRNLLVLLDNVAGPEQIRPLLPAGPGCLLLTTGRDRMTGLVATHGAHQLTLDVLSPEAALDLLVHVLGRERVDAEPAAAAAFAKLCAYLPLALRIATANLAEQPGRGIADYTEELRERDVLTALAVRGDEQTAVRTAFSLSHASLPAEARRLFRLLSLVPGTDVSGEAVAALAGTDPDRADRLLDRLAGAHLVESQAPGRYRFHDLLRRYATEQGEHREYVQDLDEARSRLYDWYLGAVDAAARVLYPHMLRLPVPETAARAPAGLDDPGSASTWLDAERGNLVAAVRAGPLPQAWRLADALRGYFWLCLHRVDWLTTAEAGLAAAEADGEPRAQAVARLSLADLQFRQGRYRLAVRHYTHARILAERTGWAEAQAAVLGNLGCAYWQAGRLPEAASRFGRGLAISRRIGQDAGEAVALGNLGLVHWEMGALTRAAEHYAQALSRYRRIGSRYGEAINLANLGQTQWARGRLAEAAEVLARALALHHEGGNRSGEAETRSRLAATYADLGRRTEALESARTGLALAQECGDPRTEAEALATLAAVLHRIGRARDAARRYRQALELIRESGDRYPEVDALVGLATATGDAGPAQHALALAERAGYRALRGLAMTALAEVLLVQGKARLAADHARAALAVHRRTGHRLGEARTLAVLERAGAKA